MAQLTLKLKDVEKIALCVLAEREQRDPRAQAVLIVRRELLRAGLLPAGDREPAWPDDVTKPTAA